MHYDPLLPALFYFFREGFIYFNIFYLNDCNCNTNDISLLGD